MKTSDQYRKFAEQCARWAEEAQTASQQKILQEMAEAWRTLAEEVEKKN
jgi:hypothetical protein